MTRDEGAKLDQLHGKLDLLVQMQTDQNRAMEQLSARVAVLDEGVTATKDVVEAWSTAKTSLRFVKWAAGILAAVLGAWIAIKGVIKL